MASDRINGIELRNALFAGFFLFDPQIQSNCFSDAKSTLCFSLYSVSLKLDKNKRSGELIRSTDRMILFSTPSSISSVSPFNSSVHQYDWSRGIQAFYRSEICLLCSIYQKGTYLLGIFLFLFFSCSCSMCFIYTLCKTWFLWLTFAVFLLGQPVPAGARDDHPGSAGEVHHRLRVSHRAA